MSSTRKRSSSLEEGLNDDNKRVKSSQLVTGGGASEDNASEAVIKDASTVTENRLETDASEFKMQPIEDVEAAMASPPSRFNSFPTEILLLIIGHLEDFWDRHFLRLTNRRFHALIQYPFTSSPPAHVDLLKLEQQLAHRILIGCRQWMACGECLRLRPTPKFSPSTAPIPGQMRVEFTRPWRVCVDCGKRPLPEGYEIGDEKSTLKSGLYGSETREHYFPPGRWWMDDMGGCWVRCFVCWLVKEVPSRRGREKGLSSRCLECAGN